MPFCTSTGEIAVGKCGPALVLLRSAWLIVGVWCSIELQRGLVPRRTQRWLRTEARRVQTMLSRSRTCRLCFGHARPGPTDCASRRSVPKNPPLCAPARGVRDSCLQRRRKKVHEKYRSWIQLQRLASCVRLRQRRSNPARANALGH